MSAQCNVAGVFPPENHQSWNDEIFWQPIPIHTTPLSDDYLLAQSKKCDRFDYEMVKYLNESDYNGLFRQYGSLVAYLRHKTGLELSSLTSIMLLYDALNIERLKDKR